MKKNQVFISYKSDGKDLQIAEQFHQELDRHQISNWFDKEQLPKKVSEEYKKHIHDLIENSELLLLIYSEKVNHSDFIIHEEVGYAISHGIPIFCFRLDDSPMSPELKQMVGSKQWIFNFQDLSKLSTGYLWESVHDEQRREFLQSLIDDKIHSSYLGEHYNDINLFLMRIAIQRYLGIPTTFGLYTQLEHSDTIYTPEELTVNIVPYSFIWEIPSCKIDKLRELGFFTDLHPVIDPDVDAFCARCDKTQLEQRLRTFIRDNYPSIKDIDAFLNDIAESTADTFIADMKQSGKRFNGAMLGVYDIRTNRTPNDERHLLTLDMYISDYFTFKFTVELYHRLRTRDNKFNITRVEQIREYAPFLCSLGMGGYIVVEQAGRKNLMWTKRNATISSGDMWHFSFDETAHLKKDAIRDEHGRVKFFGDNLRIAPYDHFYRGISEENGLNQSLLSKSESGIFEVGIIISDRLEIELLSYATFRAQPDRSIESQLFAYTENAADGKYEIEKIKYVPLDRCREEFIGHLVTPESYALYQRLAARAEKPAVRTPERVWIDPQATVGANVVFDPDVYISAGCRIGDDCKIHRHVFFDEGVTVGSRVKIQNHNNLYHGVTLSDGVFVGPNVTFSNDKHPRAIRPDGALKTSADWSCSKTLIEYGASLGAGCVIVCGVTVGRWAMVGAGAVVTKDVPPYALVYGNPAVIKGWVSDSGERLCFLKFSKNTAVMYAERENREYEIPLEDYFKTDNYFE